ncbi:MAG: AAA family ATPase [Methanomassiliicoccaceae archaeon]|jgi:dephospho-CoA kinase|nr:AAA family ATPase [Methanomassiliicoccaceae archaeon]
MRLIIVTGMPGTGKEEFLNVAVDMGIPFIRMGDVVRSSYVTRDASCEAMSVGEFAESERKRYGYDIWAKRSLERMNGPVFLVDGCRSIDEVNAFRPLTDDVIVVAIHSTPETRYERLVRRNRNDAPSTLQEFIERDDREIGWGLAKIIALADIMIPNDTTLEDLHEASRNVLERLRP